MNFSWTVFKKLKRSSRLLPEDIFDDLIYRYLEKTSLSKKVVFLVVITLLLASMLTLAFNVCRVEAEVTIYIMADGSIEGTTSIQTVDNITYLFLADINGSIVVERDYVVLDGAGHMLQGTGTGTGISLSGRTNVTVQKMQITAFEYGLYVCNCTNSTIYGNNIVKNGSGIFFRRVQQPAMFQATT